MSVTNNNELSLEDILKSFFELYKYLKAKWVQIFLVSLVGATTGFFYSKWKEPQFLAKTTFIIEEGKSMSSGLGGLASLAGQFGVDVNGNSSSNILSGDNILVYFRSPSLAREVLLTDFDSVSQKTIADVYSEVYELKKKWKEDEKIGNISFYSQTKSSGIQRIKDSLINIIIDRILKDQFSVSKTDKKSSFIDVTTIMKNEKLAKIYCERIVQRVVDRYITLKTQRQLSTVTKLQKRVDSINNLLKVKTMSGASLQTSSLSMDINPIYRTGTSVAVETVQRDKTLLATIFASVTQNLEIAKFTLSQETPVIQIIDNPEFPLPKMKNSLIKTILTFSLISIFFFVFYLVVRKVFTKKLFKN